jgi:hypothetical protein
MCGRVAQAKNALEYGARAAILVGWRDALSSSSPEGSTQLS